MFKPPVKKYYLGRLAYGTPFFWPRNFCNTIFKIRKLKLTPQEELDKLPNDLLRKAKKFSNLPLARRSKDWIIRLGKSYYWIQIGWPIKIVNLELGWKDKFDSPRYEWGPSFMIFFFYWQFVIYWTTPIESDWHSDNYYEQILWYLFYADKDIEKAKETWPWKSGSPLKSTWNDNYLIK